MSVNRKEDKWWYISFGNIFVLFILSILVIGLFVYINFYNLPVINKNIDNFKAEFYKDYTLEELKCDNEIITYVKSIKDVEEDYNKRIESLESKYIDVIASKDTINFWLNFLLVIFTLAIGGSWWQKVRMTDYADREITKLDYIVNEKKDELKVLKDDFELYKAEFERDINVIKNNGEITIKNLKEKEKIYDDKIQINLVNRESVSDSSFNENNSIESNEIYIKAKKYYDEGLYVNAINNFEKIINLDPIIYFRIGNSKFYLKLYNDAIECYDKYLEYNKKSIGALYNKGLSFENLENYVEALNLYTNVYTEDNNYLDIKFRLGYVYSKMNEYIKAIEKFDEFINSGGDNIIDAKFYKGFSLGELEKYEESIIIYDDIIDNYDNKYINAYYNKAILLNKQGYTEKAIQVCKDCLKIEPNEKTIIELKEVLEKDLEKKNPN